MFRQHRAFLARVCTMPNLVQIHLVVWHCMVNTPRTEWGGLCSCVHLSLEPPPVNTFGQRRVLQLCRIILFPGQRGYLCQLDITFVRSYRTSSILVLVQFCVLNISVECRRGPDHPRETPGGTVLIWDCTTSKLYCIAIPWCCTHTRTLCKPLPPPHNGLH